MPFKHADMLSTMTWLLEALGEHALWLPDGEPSDDASEIDRSQWVTTMVVALQASAGIRVVDEQGTVYSPEDALRLSRPHKNSYDKVLSHTLQAEPTVPPGELGPVASLGYANFFRASFPTFGAATKAAKRSGVPFQVGVPTPFAMSVFAMPGLDKLRYISDFRVALANEINAIGGEAGFENVVFQLELPLETVMGTERATTILPLRTFLVDTVRTMRLLDPRVRIGVHLCLGDKNHTALSVLHTERLAAFVQTIVDVWPRTHRLEFIHLPLAEGHLPPSTDPAFYAPLGNVWLPAHTHLVAGFIHEHRTTAELSAILRAIEGHVRRRVDVATSCGMGRVDEATARGLIAKAIAVAGTK